MTEAEFLAALRTLPLHPGANGLSDDSASLGQYVLTTDTIVETIHFLPGDLPGDVAWKLVVTNLSDLAAKGATPVGVLLNYPLSGGAWDTAFLAGFAHVLRSFDTPLLGGDTVSLPHGAPRILTLTAIGSAAAATPLRSGANPGDLLYVTGTVGNAGAGLAIARGKPGPDELLDAYRRPQPRLAEGRALAPCSCDDGRVGWPADRRAAHGRDIGAGGDDRSCRDATLPSLSRLCRPHPRHPPCRRDRGRRL